MVKTGGRISMRLSKKSEWEEKLLAEYNIRDSFVVMERMNLQKTVNVRNRPQTKKQEKNIRTFTCYTCWQKFEYLHELQNHKRTHVQEKKKGAKPNKKAPSRKNAKKQQVSVDNSVSEPAPYRCEKCKVDFRTINEVKSHPLNNCKLNCSKCDRVYNTVHGFTVHILQHKINASKPKSNSQYNCTECPAKFTDVIQLRSHSLTSHKIMTRNKIENVSADNNDEDLSCEVCFDIFKTKSELEEHMEFHKQLETTSIKTDVKSESIDVPVDIADAPADITDNDSIEDDGEKMVLKTDVDSLNTSIIIPKDENDKNEFGATT